MGNSGDIEYRLSDCGNALYVSVTGYVLEELKEAESYMERESIIAENAYEPHYTYATADSFGANLSEAPCFIEELSIEDDGERIAVGSWFYYDNYMINDFTEELAEGREVKFLKV